MFRSAFSTAIPYGFATATPHHRFSFCGQLRNRLDAVAAINTFVCASGAMLSIVDGSELLKILKSPLDKGVERATTSHYVHRLLLEEDLTDDIPRRLANLQSLSYNIGAFLDIPQEYVCIVLL
jgi:hypothetical protein